MNETEIQRIQIDSLELEKETERKNLKAERLVSKSKLLANES